MEKHYIEHHEKLVRAQDNEEDRTMSLINHPRLKEEADYDKKFLVGAKAELKPMMDFFSQQIIPNLKNPTLAEEATDEAVKKVEDLFKDK